MHILDRLACTPPRSVAVGCRVEVRLEDRLEHELGSSLHHPVPYRRDAERPLAAAGLGYQHPSHRHRLIRLLDQVLPDARKPCFQPCRLDRLEPHLINTRRAAVGTDERISVLQNVGAIDLVVEQIETELRLRLRLDIQLPLKAPDAFRCCQVHRQSPILVFFRSTPEVRTLSSAGITQPRQYYGPVRLPSQPSPYADVEVATLAYDGSPPITRITLPACLAYTPADQTGARVGCFPARAAFPESQ